MGIDGACCGPSSTSDADTNGTRATTAAAAVACCPNPNQQQPLDAAEVLRVVQQSYANTVNNNSSQKDPAAADPNRHSYDMEEMKQAGAVDANLGLGCGNPLKFAHLQNGETVLDLGSGAGVDCFLASVQVGKSGTVIGVDMTPEMLLQARQLQKKRLTTSTTTTTTTIHDNVSFRLGEIEHLPVADNTIDCVISNCVINLSPNKPQLYREIYRVLKRGGRIAISDVVNRPEIDVIPERLKTAEALAC